MTSRPKIESRYQFTGFISSGTYGRVYRAKGINGVHGDFAIKKFKPDKEGEHAYTGISQSAVREMAICAEMAHPNIIKHIETILQDKAIYMIFLYCEHDLLQIVHRHTQTIQRAIPAVTVQSIMYQLLRGTHHLHTSWVMHRDLKPANIMVTAGGQVMIGDLGLARIFRDPLVPLYSGDKVVVTIWYRAPELLMGAHHYTPAIDLWAIGCIFAELLGLRPIFKGEEAKMDSKKNVPFQKHQMQKIIDVMGVPTTTTWPSLPLYPQEERDQLRALVAGLPKMSRPLGLENWYNATLKTYPPNKTPGPAGYDLLEKLLQWDPALRITAAQALEHGYFAAHTGAGAAGAADHTNCFAGSDIQYPLRKIAQDEAHAAALPLPGTKRSGLPDDSLMSLSAGVASGPLHMRGPPAKRMREG